MPNKVRDLQATVTTHRKPVAPADLWEKLDALTEEITTYERPPNSFTYQEYKDRIQMGEASTRARIRKMIAAGKVRKVAQGWRTYYQLIDNGRTGD